MSFMGQLPGEESSAWGLELRRDSCETIEQSSLRFDLESITLFRKEVLDHALQNQHLNLDSTTY